MNVNYCIPKSFNSLIWTLVKLDCGMNKAKSKWTKTNCNNKFQTTTVKSLAVAILQTTKLRFKATKVINNLF